MSPEPKSLLYCVSEPDNRFHLSWKRSSRREISSRAKDFALAGSTRINRVMTRGGGSCANNITLAIICSQHHTPPMKGFTYILASKRNGTLYVGTTSNLLRRIEQHRLPTNTGFTAKHNVHTLVWFEQHELMAAAIQREKRIKKYPRKWKLNLIEELNPQWNDLSHWLA